MSVVDACPGDALRLLRAPRARRVALRLPRLAVAVYRLAARCAWNAATGKTLTERADALEAGARGEAHPAGPALD